MLKTRENTDLDYYLTEIKFPEQLKPSQSQVSFAFVSIATHSQSIFTCDPHVSIF